MSTVSTVRMAVNVEGSVARIELRNPTLNIIDLQMAGALVEAFEEIQSDGRISVVLLEGGGVNFSAGVDIKAHLPEQIQDMLTSFHAVIRAIVASRKVTIASVRGTCLGGGAELASVCDLVYTERDAIWGFPEIKLGCYPPVATVTLPALIGQKRAAELIFTGRRVSGDEAVAMGLANHSARAEELGTMVEESISELSQMSPVALSHAKKAMYTWDAVHFDKGLARAEKIYLEELISTADAREGIIAFLDKRPAKWTGR